MMLKPDLIFIIVLCFFASGCTRSNERIATPFPPPDELSANETASISSPAAKSILAPTPTTSSIPSNQSSTDISATVETVDSLSELGTWYNYSFPYDLGAIKAATTDEQGRTWLGSSSGLFMFNPSTQTWTSYTTAQGLLDNTVNALLRDKDTLWIGTTRGLSLLTPTGWQYHTVADMGLPRGPVKGIVRDSAGHIWVATTQGVAKFDGQGWAGIPPTPLTTDIEMLTITLNDHIWIGNADNISYFDGQQWQTSGASWSYVNLLTTDPQGHIWVGYGACLFASNDCTSAGLRQFDGQSWQSHLTTEGHNNDIGDIAFGLNFDSNGGTWVGLTSGITHFDGQTWTEHYSNDGWLKGTVRAVLFPPNAIRAIVTDTGLSYLHADSAQARTTEIEGRVWTTYSAADGLVHNSVTAITVDDNNNIWFGTEEGISRFDGQTWTNYSSADGLSHNHVTVLTVDQRGRVWAGAGLGEYCDDDDTHCISGSGLNWFDGQGWQHYSQSDSLLGNLVTALAVDQENRLWIGTDAGLNMLADGQLHHFQTLGDLSDNFITALAVIESNQLWVGTQGGGLSRFDGHDWVNYRPVDYDDIGGDYSIAALAYAQEILWVGLGGGLNFNSVLTFDGETWQSYGVEDGVLGYGVSALAIDQHGRAWVGSVGGLNEFSTPIWTYNKTNGLDREAVTALAIDAQNHKWIGTFEGVKKLTWDSP